MYQSKPAATGLEDAEGKRRAGRVPKQARGGEFGQCKFFAATIQLLINKKYEMRV